MDCKELWKVTTLSTILKHNEILNKFFFYLGVSLVWQNVSFYLTGASNSVFKTKLFLGE